LKKIRYGIIGYGLFAEKAIAPAILATSNSTLVALQKRSITEALDRALRAGIPHAFTSAAELARCADVDAVFIASANSAHCAETITAAEAGKHVLVEKPMAMNVAECRRMVDACNAHGVKLMVGQVVRFSPAVGAIRELVRTGALGRIVNARADFFIDTRQTQRTWFCDRAVAGGGPVFDIGVHCLDTLYYVLDDRVIGVRSQLFPPPTEKATEHSAVMALEFSRDTVASISVSFQAPGRLSVLELIGTEAAVLVQDFTQSSRTTTVLISRRGNDGSMQQEARTIEVPNLVTAEVEAFSRCILEGLESPVPGTTGIHHQSVLDLAMTGGGFLKEGK
jgi:predicted dehydrogenase